MANAYYLIPVDRIDDARQLAPSEGLPNQLFQVGYSPDGAKAIVQADWLDENLMNELGICLGEMQDDGFAPQAVYDEQETWESDI